MWFSRIPLKVGLASSSFWRRRVIFAGKEIRFTENIGISIISVEDPVIFSRKGIRKVFQMKEAEQTREHIT